MNATHPAQGTIVMQLPTLKQAIQFLIQDGERKQEEQFFRELHLISALTYTFGLFCWSLAIVLLPPGAALDTRSCLFSLFGMILGVALTCCARTLKSLLFSGAVSIVFITIGFRFLTSSIHDPSFWVLPLGLLITLTIAPIFNGALYYAGLFIAVWYILGTGNFPAHIGMDDHYWPALAIAANLTIGIALNISFATLRAKNYRAHAVLEALAFTDELTGLHNRRKFIMDVQIVHQDKHAAPCFFLMVDIDDFKKINDTFGHDKGDAVLVRVAAVIDQYATSNLCGRLGGEEFGILFTGNEQAVRAFAQRLLVAVATPDAAQGGVSISIGIAAVDQHARLETCFKRADESLYLAKRNGKNQFHYAGAI